jgi:hypothetical protein
MYYPICSQLRTKLLEIIDLKAEFDLELPKIKDTRDTSLALSLEDEMKRKIKSIKEVLILAHCEWVEITIGDKSKEEIIRELEEREKSDNPEDKIYISEAVRDILQKPEFTVVSQPEKITLIRLEVSDLGFSDLATTNQIYKRAAELGLELCLPEIAPHLRLNYEKVFNREQAKGEWIRIATKPITDSRGRSRMFDLSRRDDGRRWLYRNWAKPDSSWMPEDKFIFARK